MSTEPNYRRTKPGMKTSVPNSNGGSGPSSQIPGLSQSADTAPVEKNKGRRVGIQSTDSDYVKLAKQGGHKGLLSYDPDEDNGCAPQPSDQILGDSQRLGKSSKLVAPFGTDECSAWDNESGAVNDKKSPVGQASEEMQKLSVSQKDIDEANKYKRMSHDKKPNVPVNMSKLLSFGYMEEQEKKSPDDNNGSSLTPEQVNTFTPEEELE
ncbi:uncharacterized protein C7orf57 homolog [Silurus meridionalis]|uniref:Uncharacterized protein n=1 Tax=Silurus meridionalis TaxID=175797 RepID=A0A8T0BZJ6_SILME|nr:uncharacterized protein C7orf57 homolog [Silurus meridionalis]XP_046712878.1 uncharacterized protein C7orf57 homolog [Silurus meridionalis]XP_046712884.1 uncharacterized protein C7orf57 homolog [Silurus meridionalis]KAF7711087.1 hypothetical protein HF521_000098 [Silurus meridionalis]